MLHSFFSNWVILKSIGKPPTANDSTRPHEMKLKYLIACAAISLVAGVLVFVYSSKPATALSEEKLIELAELAIVDVRKFLPIPKEVKPVIEYKDDEAIVTWPWIRPPAPPRTAVFGPSFYIRVTLNRFTGKTLSRELDAS